MDTFKLLLVEDDEQEINTCRDSIDIYRGQKNRGIEIVSCKTLKEAQEKLNNTFDGAIIDLNLGISVDDGNEFIRGIKNACCRIPVIIFTGTPNKVDSTLPVFKTHTKGEIGYQEIFDELWDIYNTGLTRIMGGRGIIERNLETVFEKNLLPHIKKWICYAKEEPKRTERSLLRYTINHLLQLLDEDDDKFFPEEVYIYPPVNHKLKTGSIIRKGSEYFVVLNPMCDLVIRKEDAPKTSHILLAKIIPQDTLTNNKKENEIKELYRNNYTLYYHWLPPIESPDFNGGFLDFRILSTHKTKDFYKKIKSPDFQISPPFVKDIVARFSSFYARQGQPDIDYEKSVKKT